MEICPNAIYTPLNHPQYYPRVMLLVNSTTSVRSKAYTAHTLQGNNACLLTMFNCAIYICCYDKNELFDLITIY